MFEGADAEITNRYSKDNLPRGIELQLGRLMVHKELRAGSVCGGRVIE